MGVLHIWDVLLRLKIMKKMLIKKMLKKMLS